MMTDRAAEQTLGLHVGQSVVYLGLEEEIALVRAHDGNLYLYHSHGRGPGPLAHGKEIGAREHPSSGGLQQVLPLKGEEEEEEEERNVEMWSQIPCLTHRWRRRLVSVEMGIYASMYPQYMDLLCLVVERVSVGEVHDYHEEESTPDGKD